MKILRYVLGFFNSTINDGLRLNYARISQPLNSVFDVPDFFLKQLPIVRPAKIAGMLGRQAMPQDLADNLDNLCALFSKNGEVFQLWF